MRQPLLSESGLPAGPPAGKGLSLDPGIPGYKTFAKPSEEGPRESPNKDESMYRVDNADDLTKEQTRGDEIDHSHAQPAYYGLGPTDSPKTKYPYRDGVPNTHNASAEWVASLYQLEGAPEFKLAAEASVKVAAKLSEMTEGLNLKTVSKAKSCKATLKRVDIKNLRWLFQVDCGNGPKAVRLKAARVGSAVKMSKLDLSVSCSCKAWRWLGSEHHAVGKEYLDGKPVGTASVPVVKDPQMKNLVCKHVAAALVVARGWEVPKAPKKKV